MGSMSETRKFFGTRRGGGGGGGDQNNIFPIIIVISQRAVRTSLEKQFDPLGGGGGRSVPEIIRKPVATVFSRGREGGDVATICPWEVSAQTRQRLNCVTL